MNYRQAYEFAKKRREALFSGAKPGTQEEYEFYKMAETVLSRYVIEIPDRDMKGFILGREFIVRRIIKRIGAYAITNKELAIGTGLSTAAIRNALAPKANRYATQTLHIIDVCVQKIIQERKIAMDDVERYYTR